MTPNIRDVAVHAGVSVGTVSNVLNRPAAVSPSTTERVQAAIAALGFVPNDAARQLRAGLSRSIGLVVLDIRNPFFTDVARGAEERAAAERLAVLLVNSDERADREAAHLELFEQQRVRGLIVSPVGEVLPRLARLRAHGTPVVLLDRAATTPGWSSVSVDDVLGGQLAARHLLEQGRRRLLFVGGPLELPQVRDRLHGADMAVQEVPGAQLETLPVETLGMRSGVDAGRAILERDQYPDGVFAANDLLALGVLQSVALDGRLRVPEDLALVGYDDIEFAAAAAVPITSIRQPRELMGATAVELLLAELDGERGRRQVVLEPELIVRASTAADK